MFDDQHLWYQQFEVNQVPDRLRILDGRRRTVLAVACVTRAKDVLLANLKESEICEFLPSVELLISFWKAYPQSLEATLSGAIASEANTVVPNVLGPKPDGVFLRSPGAEPLLWATLYCLTLCQSDRPAISAYDSLERAYCATFRYFGERTSPVSSDRMRDVELSTKQCVDMLSFQLQCLRLIEDAAVLPLDYWSITSRIS